MAICGKQTSNKKKREKLIIHVISHKYFEVKHLKCNLGFQISKIRNRKKNLAWNKSEHLLRKSNLVIKVKNVNKHATNS